MLVLARWVHFTSLFVLFGSSFFWLSMGPAPTRGLPWSACRTVQLIRIAAPVAAASGAAWLVAMIANMTGEFAGVVDPETLHAFFFETPFGPLTFARLFLFGIMMVLAIAPMTARYRFVFGALISALLLVSQAWLGHAAEGGETLYGAFMIVAYAVHVLAGAAWIGGLPPLLLAIVAQHRCNPGSRHILLDLLSRYSAMAVVAVSLIVVTGIANTAFRVGAAVGSLTSTTYGDVLLAKLTIVALMLVLAAFNRFVMMPRLGRHLDSAMLLDRLRASLVWENLLAILLLGAVAMLGITPPP